MNHENEHFSYKKDKSGIEIDHTFEAIIQKNNQKVTEERNYEDISYVNFWTDKNGNTKYRIYMKNGEVLFLTDNEKFHREYCPCGVNVVSEVTQEKYL